MHAKWITIMLQSSNTKYKMSHIFLFFSTLTTSFLSCFWKFQRLFYHFEKRFHELVQINIVFLFLYLNFSLTVSLQIFSNLSSHFIYFSYFLMLRNLVSILLLLCNSIWEQFHLGANENVHGNATMITIALIVA